MILQWSVRCRIMSVYDLSGVAIAKLVDQKVQLRKIISVSVGGLCKRGDWLGI